MPYDTVVRRIQQLINEQQLIHRSSASSGLGRQESVRLAEIKVELQRLRLWLERKRERVRFREERKFTRVG